MRPLLLVAVLLFSWPPTTLRAGLYYSGEALAELPSQWRGFLLDQRMLRQIATPPRQGVPLNPARQRYQREAERLSRLGTALTADQVADLGALLVRLGEPAKAVAILRVGQRKYPVHFRIAANLGTAWQQQGEPSQAAACLQVAVRLAPPDLRRVEEFHLRLLQQRLREGAGARGLDDLFGLRYVGDVEVNGSVQGAAPQRDRLPADAVAITQRLALWLPADARLLWQLAELAAAHGEVRMSAAIMDGCVTELGLDDPNLRRHRRQMRAAADALSDSAARTAHESHSPRQRPRSRRPLLARPDQPALQPVRPNEVNPLPWALLGDTSLGGKAGPEFPPHLQKLDGRRVSLTGFVQPLGDDPEAIAFLLVEAPIGCWYCETPEITGMVHVEIMAGRPAVPTRAQVRIIGRLRLNRTEPERFLYTITNATIALTD